MHDPCLALSISLLMSSCNDGEKLTKEKDI